MPHTESEMKTGEMMIPSTLEEVQGLDAFLNPGPALFHHFPHPIWGYHPTGKLLYRNLEARKLHDPESLHDHGAGLNHDLKKLLEGKKIIKPFISELNQRQDIEIQFMPGNSEWIWLCGRDITADLATKKLLREQKNLIGKQRKALKEAREALKKQGDHIHLTHQKFEENEEKFKIISEQSLLGIIILQHNQIIYVNEALAAASGYTRSELLSSGPNGFYKLVHPDDLPLLLEKMNYLFNAPSDETSLVTFRGITKKGEIRWHQKWGKIVHIGGEKALMMTVLDIDEVKRRQDDLTETENQLRAKLDFILSPEKSDTELKLTDIFDVSQLQKIQDAFADSHHVASIITDQEGIPITRPSNFSGVCQMIRTTKTGSALCQKSDKLMGKKSLEVLRPNTVKCLTCGFVDAGAPIIVGGKHVATWIIGHSMPGNTDQEKIMKLALKTGLDTGLLMEAYSKIQFLEKKQFEKVIDFLWLLAKEISALGYNNARMARDIEERKKIEKELIDARNKAEEADQLKSAFLANMSHEIRTPMNAIIGFANLLNEPETTAEERMEYTGIINQSGKSLLKLIDDILDLAKIEAGQLTFTESSFDIEQLLNEQCKMYKMLASKLKEQPVQILLKIPQTLHHKKIVTDKLRLNQILTNLISNALKFTSKGFVEFGYKLNRSGYLEFYVKDTGIGLAADKHKIIFERFRQADQAYTKRYGGTGLGLAISANLIRLMGGNIWVESEEGKGATFRFTLPYKPDRVIPKG